MRRTPPALAASALLLLSGCALQIPSDPEGTLDRASSGVLRVGDSSAPAQEVALVEGFADRIDARIRWTRGGEERLMTALDDGDLDLVVGGLTADTPWSTHAAITRPYAESTDDRGRTVQHVMAARLGENALLVELETYLESVAP